jgi:hypothetical protein
MTTPLHAGATLRDLFYGDIADGSAEALTRTLRDNGAVKPFLSVRSALSAAEGEVAGAIDGLLSLSLVDLLASGWKKYGVLRQAVKRTRAAPGTEETVVLATHHIDSTHRPSIDLWVDGTRTRSIDVTISATFTVDAVRAVVSQGRLTTIKTGTCTATGSLAVAGIDMIKKKRSLDLPGAVRLRGGISLLDTAPIT